MTKSEAINKILDIAEDEIGYLEKSTKAYRKNPQIVYDKTKGAGRDNITKYWQDTKPGYQGQAWCQDFVFWLFVKAFGLDKAKKALYLDDWKSYEPWSNFACFSWADNFQKHNARYQSSKAQVGDIIYFTKSHTGIVYKIADGYVYTIEGNTSGASEVISNGGGVCAKKYKLGADAIYCYGRANWSAVLSGTKRPVIHKGDKGEAVKEMQEMLIKAGYSCGKHGADGKYGGDTYKAVMRFQEDHKKEIGAEPDGVVGSGTWRALEKAANG